MAHFAELDANNIVIRVIVVANSDCLDQDGNENEAIGALYCHRLFGGRWIQTSYNGNIRGHFAGVGWPYDPRLDAFIPPKPYPSWIFNETTLNWEAPIPYPQDGNTYWWDETTGHWVIVIPDGATGPTGPT